LEDILALASVRVLRSAISDESKKYIGGKVQACLISNHIAEHLVCSDGVSRFLRSALIEDFDAREYPTLNLDHPWLDLARPLKDLVDGEEEMPPLISAPSQRSWRRMGL